MTIATLLASSLNPSTYCRRQRHLHGDRTGTAPTGSVTFTADGAAISGCGAVALTGSGNARTATCSTAGLTAGPHGIMAVYGGDARAGAPPARRCRRWSRAGRRPVQRGEFGQPSLVGASVTFTATVTGTAPTGSVTFTADGAATQRLQRGGADDGNGNARTATCSTAGLCAVPTTSSRVRRQRREQWVDQRRVIAGGQCKPARSTALAVATVRGRYQRHLHRDGHRHRADRQRTFTADGAATQRLQRGRADQGQGEAQDGHLQHCGPDRGTHGIVAAYGGDSGNSGSTSAALSQE